MVSFKSYPELPKYNSLESIENLKKNASVSLSNAADCRKTIFFWKTPRLCPLVLLIRVLWWWWWWWWWWWCWWKHWWN